MGKKPGGRQDLLPGTLDMLVLKTLSIGVMHGYGIAQHIHSVSGEVLQVEEGSLYTALQRLQLQGLVDSEYYRLTRAGRRALGAAESSFAQLIAAIGRVMRPA
jgi:PadR family transcriptional regulator PadR